MHCRLQWKMVLFHAISPFILELYLLKSNYFLPWNFSGENPLRVSVMQLQLIRNSSNREIAVVRTVCHWSRILKLNIWLDPELENTVVPLTSVMLTGLAEKFFSKQQTENWSFKIVIFFLNKGYLFSEDNFYILSKKGIKY